MIVKTLKIKDVLIQFIFSFSSFLFFLTDFLISLFLQLFILITIIIPSSPLSMLRPISQTKPTEFVSTHFASHMIATLVLLYWFPTLRTLFCVSHDPCYVLTFISILSFPLLSELAVSGSMWFKSTLEAEGVATFANDICHAKILEFYTVVTTLVRTPSHTLIVISVWFAMPFIIGDKVLSLQILIEHRMWHNNIALMLGTLGLYSSKPIIYSLY